MNGISDVLAKCLRQIEDFGEMDLEPDTHPTILINRNLDAGEIARIESGWSGHFNDAWQKAIEQKIEEGFQIIRVQTEWEGADNGHATKIYMAKLRPAT